MGDYPKKYAGLNFVSRIFLDSATGGTFMEITLGEATKFLDNIMANYSQWFTERAPTSKKVNSVEEINSLSGKVDALMKLVANKMLLLILMMCVCLLWLRKIVMP